MEEIDKKLEELEKRKAKLYRQKQMLFMRLKSAIALLGQYIEFAEKQDTDFSSLGEKPEPVPAMAGGGDIISEIKRTWMVINRILGLSKLPSPYDETPSLPEIDESIKRVVQEIKWKTKDKEFIAKRRER